MLAHLSRLTAATCSARRVGVRHDPRWSDAMTLSRRDFLRQLGITAGAAAVLDFVDAPYFSIERLAAAPLAPSDLEALANVALDKARKLGCSYADIRINRYRNRSVALRTSPDRSAGMMSGKVNSVPAVVETESFGFGVRVLHSGAWGFAASPTVDKDTIARVTTQAAGIARANAALRQRPVELAAVPAYRDRYETQHTKDPFAVSVQDQIGFLQSVNDAVKKVKGIVNVNSNLTFRTEDKYFASTDGSYIQ